MAEQSVVDPPGPLKERTINDFLTHRATHQATTPYVIYGNAGRTVTYREMNDVANTIGHNLRALVDGTDQRNVAVMMQSQLPILQAFHGILKAGMVYAPVHHEYKGENLSYQLTDSSAAVVVIDDRYVHRLNEVQADLRDDLRVIVRTTDDESEPLADGFDRLSFDELTTGPTAEPDADVAWEDIATIIYTSGTTGRPKGVLHSHRQVLVLFGALKATFMSAEDIVHNNLPLFHVGGLYGNVVATLLAGATVVCWDKFSTSEFWNRVDEYGATRAVIFSSMITWLDNQPRTDTDHHNTLNKVTFVPLVDEYEAIAERFGFDIVDTYYGQTEIGLSVAGAIRAATGEHATPAEYRQGRSPDAVVRAAESKGIPVVDEAPGTNWAGKPASPVEVALLNEHDERLGAGEVGELAARPEEPSMIFQGYVNSPAETLETWGNLWHHTGDALERDADGHYYFVDRIDDVIRRRGENIATAQIEEPLKKHASIENVAAFSVPAVDGAEDEVAIGVVLADGVALDEAAIRAIAADRLPRFMVPRYVEIVDEMPKTDTAKIEKYKLRDQLIAREGLE
ncbi:AMP-binding protein [Halorubellus litoreus]|uniref:AMP-binding protein n=1 Tax=Halorubellus litoreus TaxID=755308 RepID=A0ABD5VGX2_9EURY